MAAFPQLLELWGDGPLLPLPPEPRPFLGVPTWAPWAGPVVDEANAKNALIREWLHEGKTLPAHTYTEFSSPPVSPWWPPAVMSLHAGASQEEQEIKLTFENKYPYRHRRRRLPCRDALIFPPGFLDDRILLHARLACTQVIFWIRTRVETGSTASAIALENARPGARAAAAAAAEQQYTWALLQDDYLAAWLGYDTIVVGGWGTSRDPRIGRWSRLPKPNSRVRASQPDLSGWGSTAAWSTQVGGSGFGSDWGTGSWDNGWPTPAPVPSPLPEPLRFRAQ